MAKAKPRKPRPRKVGGFKTEEAPGNSSHNGNLPDNDRPPAELTDFYTTARESDLEKLQAGPDDTWLKDNDCAEHVLPLPAIDTLDSTTRDRFQFMQQVEAQWQEAPALTAKDAHAPATFIPGEHDHADCFDHEIDPWLREPLEFVPETGIPLGHLGVFMKNDMVNQIQDERRRAHTHFGDPR